MPAGQAADHRWRIRARTAMGNRLPDGGAIAISTGALMPAGADHVLISEHAEESGEGDAAVVLAIEPQPLARHLRKRGGDFCDGAQLLPVGHLVRPLDLGLLAAAGVRAISSARKPLVAVVTIGSELTALEAETGQTRRLSDSNALAIPALFRSWGADAWHAGRIEDNKAAIVASLSDILLARPDMVVVVGGASNGRHDLARRAALDAGATLIFAGSAVRPGKPLWLAKTATCPILGLPGNPGSAIATGAVAGQAMVRRMLGLLQDAAVNLKRMPVAASLPATGSFDMLIRARMTTAVAPPARWPLRGRTRVFYRVWFRWTDLSGAAPTWLCWPRASPSTL
ncbi:MAG: hypothetical protein HC774_00350 [Sphingomonadales bacterium]|nr:hypothetical protein [Sphingomonadales bacterium]